MFIEQFGDLFERLASYAPWAIAIELLLIWVVIYAVVRFLQGTRAAGAIRILIVSLIVFTVAMRALGAQELLPRLDYLYERTLALLAIALIVVFQPELRRAILKLGDTQLRGSGAEGVARVAAEVAEACGYLAKNNFGAILAIERSSTLANLAEAGTRLDATLTSRLIQTIFWPGSALHDLAVIVRSGRVAAAGVQLPLADPEDMPSPQLGSRHRAAVGLSKETDAIVVVVSEETGLMRIAERGRLSQSYEREELERQLRLRLGDRGPTEPTGEPAGEDPGEDDSGLSDEGIEDGPRSDDAGERRDVA
ncbi:MAG: diadenylate cyclase [Planctomycetota bacterium]